MKILSTCLAGLALAVSAPGQAIPIDGYAAVVNDSVITVSDVMTLIQPMERQLKAQYDGEELKERMLEAYRDARDTLVERALILADFEQSDGMLPEQAIDERMEEIIRVRFNNDRAAFLRALTEERLTLEEWREEIHDTIVVDLLRQQEVTSKINVSPSDLYTLYRERAEAYRVPEKIKLRMIILNKGATPEEQAVKWEEARKLREKVAEGEDFGELARASSEGAKADRGGDWGWIEPTDLNATLGQAVADLQTGEVSPVIESDDELYLLMIEGRQQASMIPFEEVQDELRATLRQAEADKLYEAWVARLRGKYFVKVY